MGRPHWKEIAETLAERVSYMVDACPHDDDEPHPEACCLDRAAYNEYVTAGGYDHRAAVSKRLSAMKMVSIIEVSAGGNRKFDDSGQ